METICWHHCFQEEGGANNWNPIDQKWPAEESWSNGFESVWEDREVNNREIADKIREHLKRFEADPTINKKHRGLSTYWSVGAGASGRYVYVQYIAYQGSTALSKADALVYLAWLDAGNVGRHYKALDGVKVTA